MFKSTSLILLIATSLPTFASVRQIHSITETMVKFTNGEVAFWDQDFQTLNQYIVEENDLVEVDVDQNNEIMHILPIEMPAIVPSKSGVVGTSTPFAPTVIANYSEAQKIMNTFNKTYLKGSECYDRAHIWSYETFQIFDTQSEKAFLFFADHYITNFRFKWWFHVAPVVKVNMKGNIEERVMDVRFSKNPLKMKLWTNIFMKNGVECKTVPLYTDYSQHPNEDDCYIIKSSMFYWQPKDLEEFARSGYEKTEFVPWEVRHAYKNAFGVEK